MSGCPASRRPLKSIFVKGLGLGFFWKVLRVWLPIAFWAKVLTESFDRNVFFWNHTLNLGAGCWLLGWAGGLLWGLGAEGWVGWGVGA